jgi:hypothetical protein
MDSSKLKIIILLFLCAFGAVYLGTGLVTAQTQTVFNLVVVISFLFCLFLGRKIWLLIPFFVPIGYRISIVGTPTTELIAGVLFIAFSLPLFLLRRLPFQIRNTELEMWALILFICVLQVFARHPVGLGAFTSEQIGGKPYLFFVLYLLIGLGMSYLRVPPQELRFAMKLGILGGIIGVLLGIFGSIFPQIGIWYGVGGVNADDSEGATMLEAGDTGKAGRISYLGGFAKNLSLWICTFKTPLSTLFHPLWGGLLVLSLGCAALSGFRSIVAMVIMTYILGILYRGGIRHLIASSLIGAALLLLLALVNSAMPLPANIQRALSFLPGTWEELHVRDAEGSSEWRFEMWREALSSDRYIHNKWIGDGLGFRREEIERGKTLQDMKAKGLGGWDAHRENIMITGDFHSGPVQTIKTVGVVGLIVLLAAMLRLAVHAHRQIERCRGTEWLPVALFFGIPVIYYPFYFVLIFGTFQFAIAAFMLGLGMIRLLENNLPLPAYVPLRHRHAAPLPAFALNHPAKLARHQQ